MPGAILRGNAASYRSAGVGYLDVSQALLFFQLCALGASVTFEVMLYEYSCCAIGVENTRFVPLKLKVLGSYVCTMEFDCAVDIGG